MDAFFASVEQRDNPGLRGKPVAVGGRGPRSVIAAASYEAREFGVHSAMPASRALRLCPQLLIVPHRFDEYRKTSNTIRDIFRSVTPLVEPLSLDEAYLEISHLKLHWEESKRVALFIKENIRNETQLTASAGISINKFLAKIASDLEKPDGLSVIMPEAVASFLDQLPIGKFHGIGKVTAEKMKLRGIHTGADLKALSELELATHFGKPGRYFYQVVRGIDNREVKPERQRKSLSVERTYSEDLTTTDSVIRALEVIAEELSRRIAKADVKGTTINLKVRYRDFTTLTRQHQLNSMDYSKDEMFREALDLLDQLIKPLPPIRLLGLGVSGFDTSTESNQQLKMPFDDQ